MPFRWLAVFLELSVVHKVSQCRSNGPSESCMEMSKTAISSFQKDTVPLGVSFEKVSQDDIASFQAYTIRNLDNKMSTHSDIATRCLVSKKIPLRIGRSILMSCAFLCSFPLETMVSFIPDMRNSPTMNSYSIQVSCSLLLAGCLLVCFVVARLFGWVGWLGVFSFLFSLPSSWCAMH